MPNPQSSGRASPSSSQKQTNNNNNHVILWINDIFMPGSSQSKELNTFVDAWNQEIVKNGGAMTTRSPSYIDKLQKQAAQNKERANNPAKYAGKVVGHVPDVVAGGSPANGPFMPLDGRVNSSIGSQVQHEHSRSVNSTGGGLRYNEVRIRPPVQPKPPPPPKYDPRYTT
jgi:hypothetical protein